MQTGPVRLDEIPALNHDGLITFVNIIEDLQSLVNADLKVPKETFELLNVFANSFNNYLLIIKNRYLKALIMHDTKGMVLGFKAALKILENQSRVANLETVNIAIISVNKLKHFIELVRLTTVESISPQRQIMLLSNMVSTLVDICYEVDPGVNRARYIHTLTQEQIELNIISNFKALDVSDAPELVFAIHTILLNMVNLGVTRIECSIELLKDRVQILIKDNIVIDNSIELINKSLWTEPSEDADTQELIARKGLSLSNALIRSIGGYINCNADGQTSKYFTIVLPLERMPIVLQD